MTISLDQLPSFRPSFIPSGDIPRAVRPGPVDTFERVGSGTDRSVPAGESVSARREAKIGAAVGAIGAVGLMALFFANPIVGTAAIFLSALGIIGGAIWVSEPSR